MNTSDPNLASVAASLEVDQRPIEKRGRELMRLHPDLSADIAAYIEGQAEECRVIMDDLEGAVWLLRRAQ